MAGAFSNAFSSAFDVGAGGGGSAVPVFGHHYASQGVETMWLRQSTASQEIILGPFVDDTDGKTAETALSIANTDIKLWKEGGTTEASKNSGGATHIASGRYYAVLDATDTDTLGKLEIHVHVAGALPVRRVFMVLPAMVYDSMILGTDRFDVNVTHIGDTAQTARDIGASVLLSSGTGTGQLDFTSGILKVDVNTIKTQTVTCAAGVTVGAFVGQGTAAIGVNASGHVSRVVLCDTITTYTGNTVQTGDSYAIVNSGTHGNAAIKGYVDDIGVAGAGLTALGDTRLANLDAAVSTRLASAGYTAPPSAATIAATTLAAGDVDGFSLEETLKLCLAALAGKLSGAATTTVTIRAADDSKARITATVDADGNRTAITLDEVG